MIKFEMAIKTVSKWLTENPQKPIMREKKGNGQIMHFWGPQKVARPGPEDTSAKYTKGRNNSEPREIRQPYLRQPYLPYKSASLGRNAQTFSVNHGTLHPSQMPEKRRDTAKH